MIKTIILVCVGLLFGYVIGEISRVISGELHRVLTNGFPLTLAPTRLGVPDFAVTFGFHLVLNLANILGVIVAFWAAQRFHW